MVCPFIGGAPFPPVIRTTFIILAENILRANRDKNTSLYPCPDDLALPCENFVFIRAVGTGIKQCKIPNPVLQQVGFFFSDYCMHSVNKTFQRTVLVRISAVVGLCGRGRCARVRARL